MKPFNIHIIAIGAAISAAVSGVSAQQLSEFEPERFDAARYTESLNASPFEREILSKPIGVEPIKPLGFSIIGATGDGKSYRVILVDRSGRYQVVTEKPNANGFYYVGIDPSQSIQDFRVQVARLDQREWLVFDRSRFNVGSTAVAKEKSKRAGQGKRVVVPLSGSRNHSSLTRKEISR